MVVHVVYFLKHPKKGRFEEHYLSFIPDADDITQAQLDYFIEHTRNHMDYALIPRMIDLGIYKDETALKRAMKRGTLKFDIIIKVIVDETLLQERVADEDKEAFKKVYDDARKNNKSGIHTIEYHYFDSLKYVTRGLRNFEYYVNDYIRQEWSDLLPDQKFYELGDVIRFRHMDEIKEGIICLRRRDEFFETRKDQIWIFTNSYEVVVEEPSYTYTLENGKTCEHKHPYKYYFEDEDVVHANDIIEFLGNDFEKLKRMMREYNGFYTTEYLEEIGVIE